MLTPLAGPGSAIEARARVLDPRLTAARKAAAKPSVPVAKNLQRSPADLEWSTHPPRPILMRVNVARSRRLLDVRGPRVGLGYAVGVVGTAAGAAAMLPFRGHLDATDVVLIFLVVVVAAAATGGLGPGATAAVLGFLVSDILFVPPYDTLLVSKAQDLVSLAVYLLVTLVVSTLVGTSEQRRRRA